MAALLCVYACLWKPEIDSIFPVTLHSISITITIIIVVLLTKAYYVALVGLELALQTRLALDLSL